MKYIGIVVLTIALLFTTANATIWYVHPDSTLNSIQAGLNNCATGDTVLVGPGTYIENITWPATQGIDLISEYGPDTTIIDGDSAGRVITIPYLSGIDTTTVIRGFTIRNGYLDGGTDGAGIRCMTCSPRIVNNVFTANVSANGGAGGAIACISNSSAVIDSNTMSSNSSNFSGAIHLRESDATITNNVIHDNAAVYGGGIHFQDNSDATITGNLIYNNSAGSVCGGIICLQSDASIRANTITGNSADQCGGVGFYDISSPVLSNNLISANTANSHGGGVFFWNQVALTATDNVITENTCTYSTTGGGIWCGPNTAQVVIKHCNISNNTGVGICIDSVSPDIDSCSIENNTHFGVNILVGSNPTVNWCNIAGNQYAGMFNGNASVTINAENNWWGDASGPGGAGPGSGNPVSTYVDYDPWLTDSVQGIGVEEVEIAEPLVVSLQVSPNPFTNMTQIRCMIHDTQATTEANRNIGGSAGRTSDYQKPEIRIYDASGRLVKDFRPTLDALRPTQISWDGTDQSSRQLPSGVYFVQFTSGDYAKTQKVLLVR